MFDPTVYENLKVVIEGAVYDLDLNGKIDITKRIDNVELSTMSRHYAIQFNLKKMVLAEIQLTATTDDLSAEILELEKIIPGCQLNIVFYKQISIPLDQQCKEIQKKLQQIWGENISIEQQISFQYGQSETYHNEIQVMFHRKITEKQIDDIPSLLDHVFRSLEALETL